MTQDSPPDLSLLDADGFTVLPGPFGKAELPMLAASYDSLARRQGGRLGSTSFRSATLRGADSPFDRLLDYPPLLEAARCVVGPDFELSAFHGRTLLPHVPAKPLHQDFVSNGEGWPMLGFILMIDPFRRENGATRFLAGSQSMRFLAADPPVGHPALRQACGEAGSLIIYNGSVWHEHGANLTGQPRRSVQGAMVRL